jgi:hypothetical protein
VVATEVFVTSTVGTLAVAVTASVTPSTCSEKSTLGLVPMSSRTSSATPGRKAWRDAVMV